MAGIYGTGLPTSAHADQPQGQVEPLEGFVRVEHDGHVRFLNLRHVVTYRPTVVDEQEIVVYELVDGRSVVSEGRPGER